MITSVRFRVLACAILLLGSVAQASARDMSKDIVVAAAPQADGPKEDVDEAKLTPEERMSRRFPQPIRVGALIGLPVLDWSDSTIGFIQQVVRTPEGKIQLIVPYRSRFGWLPAGVVGWGTRPVAVPIETVAILGRQVAALEMEPDDFEEAPTFVASQAAVLSPEDSIRIAITRR
jgi:hypothetical protein